jgi:hypothetical protein
LVKGLRVAGVKTLEQANAYLESEYLPEWEDKFTVVADCGDNAHRPLGKQHVLEASLCRVDSHVIASDFTIRHNGKLFQIAAEHIRPRMRGGMVRVESRGNGELAARFEDRYLKLTACNPAPKTKAKPVKRPIQPGQFKTVKSKWMDGFWKRPAPSLPQAIAIANATS